MTDSYTLSNDEASRYSRHMLLPGVGIEGQKRLKAARVLIVGAGGLGSPCALYLAAAGIGTLGIADADRVEEHNLHRQILHHEGSIGTLKVTSAQRTLNAQNPNCEIVTHSDGMTPQNALTLAEGYDILVDGSDNFATRHLVNDAAFFAGKPLISGSALQFGGSIQAFNTRAGTPCLRCIFPKTSGHDGTQANCSTEGILGPVCGYIGSLQALEVLKYILGIGKLRCHDRVMGFHALENKEVYVTIKKDPNCPLCGERPKIINIDPRNYKQCFQNNLLSMPDNKPTSESFTITVHEAYEKQCTDIPALFLDIREPHEWDLGHIPGAVHIPLGELEARISELTHDGLTHDRPIIVYCHSGFRSLQGVALMHAQGFKQAKSLSGGIDAWSQHIDSTIARY